MPLQIPNIPMPIHTEPPALLRADFIYLPCTLRVMTHLEEIGVDASVFDIFYAACVDFYKSDALEYAQELYSKYKSTHKAPYLVEHFAHNVLQGNRQTIIFQEEAILFA